MVGGASEAGSGVIVVGGARLGVSDARAAFAELQDMLALKRRIDADIAMYQIRRKDGDKKILKETGGVVYYQTYAPPHVVIQAQRFIQKINCDFFNDYAGWLESRKNRTAFYDSRADGSRTTDEKNVQQFDEKSKCDFVIVLMGEVYAESGQLIDMIDMHLNATNCFVFPYRDSAKNEDYRQRCARKLRRFGYEKSTPVKILLKVTVPFQSFGNPEQQRPIFARTLELLKLFDRFGDVRL